jgi:signal transduction histidine kinase
VLLAHARRPGWLADRAALLAQPHLRLVAGSALVGSGYWLLAKLGAAVQYQGYVEVAWLPVGWAAAMLYLGDLRWFAGATIADLLYGLSVAPPAHYGLINPTTLQTVSNTLEFMIAAVLMRRWLGRHSTLEQPVDVARLFAAIAAGAAISALLGSLTTAWAGEAEWDRYLSVVRTWWLGDTSGGLLVAPLVIVWGAGRWRGNRRSALRAVAVVGIVIAASFVVFESRHPLDYLVFPVLGLAAVSLGQRGATVALAAAIAVSVAMTASNLGPFLEHSITDEALDTQLYVMVAILTTLTLGAAVSARRRSALELVESRRREGEAAPDERQRIARDLHDSVSQTLFSLGLHAGIARHELARGAPAYGAASDAVDVVSELAQAALLEMRASIFELRGGAVAEQGLVAALSAHAAALSARHDVSIDVSGPDQRLPLEPDVHERLFRVGQEALSNAVKHARADRVSVEIRLEPGRVRLTVRDQGVGFDPACSYPGHMGLELMRSRMRDVGGWISIDSAPGAGTTVTAGVPAGGRRSASP